MNRLAVRTATFRRIAITTVLMILYTDGMMQTNGLFSRGYLDMTEGQNAACIVISVRFTCASCKLNGWRVPLRN